MKNLLCFILAFGLFGCSALDQAMTGRGVIRDQVSEFDGKRVVAMSPVIARSGFNGERIEFGLYWDDAKGDRAMLEVMMTKAINFEPKESFKINVDGNMLAMMPVDDSSYGDKEVQTYPSVMNTTTKRFWISKEEIMKLANAKKSTFRIYFLDGYIEGNVDYDWSSMASYVPIGFKTFHSRVWSNN